MGVGGGGCVNNHVYPRVLFAFQIILAWNCLICFFLPTCPSFSLSLSGKICFVFLFLNSRNQKGSFCPIDTFSFFSLSLFHIKYNFFIRQRKRERKRRRKIHSHVKIYIYIYIQYLSF